MKLLLGILCTFLTITQSQVSAQVNGLTCVTDYIFTINCFLKSITTFPNDSGNNSYWLEFNFYDLRVFNCSLMKGENGYNCTFSTEDKQQFFSDFYIYTISLFHMENGIKKSSVQAVGYKPSQHIKPPMPKNLMVNRTHGNYTFTWISGYESHKYARVLSFQYLLSYHKEDNPENEVTIHAKKTWIDIPESMLEPDTQYIAKVCNQVINGSKYYGTTSEWSTAVKWKTSHQVEESYWSLLPSSAGVVILICLAVAMTFLLLYPVARMKLKKVILVVRPEPSLQTLFQNHPSNLKDRMPKSHVQEIYSEEISTIDKITEITAVVQDQVMTCSMNFTPLYHTPYVGPSADVAAPFQMSNARSVASFSSKDFNFLPEEDTVEEPMLCWTAFNPINVGGFVCIEDLELSNEDMEPSETLTITSKPTSFTQNGQNYCTLTNTTAGLIPTFTTGPGNPELVSGNQVIEFLNTQTEESTIELVPLSLDSLQLSMEE
ncbi:interleukin 21 receptor, tandem duplicate 2 [Hoplias malabaricus]|uniref:interleukin 21 receptor, tandem duplicate 2 n=1 Tax=Hoplias malabaricus TaxID=27720 RepID=UPI003462F2B9